MTSWRRYWFAPAPVLDLAMARICVIAILLALDGTTRFLIVGHAPAGLWKPVSLIGFLGLSKPDVGTMLRLAWTTATFLVLAGVGLATRVALVALVPLLVLQESLLMSVGKTTHASIPLLYAVLFLALSPCQRRLAIDPWLCSRFHRARPRAAESEFARWPIDLLYVVLSGLYFSAGVSKLLWSGPRWADGATLQYHLLAVGTPLGLRLAESPTLCALGSGTVLAWELAFPLGAIRRLRPAFLVGGVAFHLATRLLLDIGFWPVPTLYLVFVPWSKLAAWMRRGLTAVGSSG